jgi:hypothetical protein
MRPRSKLGTVVSYILNQAATVRFTVEQLLPGRTTKRGAQVHCLVPARHNRKDPRCTRIVALRGSLIVKGKAGKNAFRFTGRIGGKELARGGYVLVARPSADGTAGTSVRIAFRVGSWVRRQRAWRYRCPQAASARPATAVVGSKLGLTRKNKPGPTMRIGPGGESERVGSGKSG